MTPSTRTLSPGTRLPIGFTAVRSSYRCGNRHSKSPIVCTPSLARRSATFGPTPVRLWTGRSNSDWGCATIPTCLENEDAVDLDLGAPRQLRDTDCGTRRIRLLAVVGHDL